MGRMVPSYKPRATLLCKITAPNIAAASPAGLPSIMPKVSGGTRSAGPSFVHTTAPVMVFVVIGKGEVQSTFTSATNHKLGLALHLANVLCLRSTNEQGQ